MLLEYTLGRGIISEKVADAQFRLWNIGIKDRFTRRHISTFERQSGLSPGMHRIGNRTRKPPWEDGQAAWMSRAHQGGIPTQTDAIVNFNGVLFKQDILLITETPKEGLNRGLCTFSLLWFSCVTFSESQNLFHGFKIAAVIFIMRRCGWVVRLSWASYPKSVPTLLSQDHYSAYFPFVDMIFVLFFKYILFKIDWYVCVCLC